MGETRGETGKLEEDAELDGDDGFKFSTKSNIGTVKRNLSAERFASLSTYNCPVAEGGNCPGSEGIYK